MICQRMMLLALDYRRHLLCVFMPYFYSELYSCCSSGHDNSSHRLHSCRSRMFRWGKGATRAVRDAMTMRARREDDEIILLGACDWEL